jgi:hypothetical protein
LRQDRLRADIQFHRIAPQNLKEFSKNSNFSTYNFVRNFIFAAAAADEREQFQIIHVSLIKTAATGYSSRSFLVACCAESSSVIRECFSLLLNLDDIR